MFDINKWLEAHPRSSVRGAPMGFTNHYEIPSKPGRTYTIGFDKVKFVDGCYGPDGTYWGSPENLWCFYSVEEDESLNCQEVLAYFRASNPTKAIEQFKGDFSPEVYDYTIEPLDDHLLHQFVDGLPHLVDHYLQAVAFTDFGDTDQPPSDSKFSPVAKLEAYVDILDFIHTCYKDGMFSGKEGVPSPMAEAVMKGYSLDSFAHDFWLTRNRHGVGFWDRGLGKLGDHLTTWAHAAGSRSAYLGDDNLVYFE